MIMINNQTTKEEQYGILFDVAEKHGISSLGLMINESWNQDPKRTLFTLARYKFVAKMLEGYDRVLEVGCADAFGTRIVQQAVNHVTAIDFDPIFIDDAQNRLNPNWPMDLETHGMLSGPINRKFQAIYSLDVLEHIQPDQEDIFLSNMLISLIPTGALIVGMPSIESQIYASPQSIEGHANCKTGSTLKAFMIEYFSNVFYFL